MNAFRTVGVSLVFLTGLIAAAFGVWFAVSDQPFDNAGYADEFEMNREEIAAFNPRVESWSMHVQNQIGSLTFGWGVLVMGLAVTGLRQGVQWARRLLWFGALPTVLYSALHEFLEFGTIDVGTLSSMFVAAIFVLGMGLTYVGSDVGTVEGADAAA